MPTSSLLVLAVEKGAVAPGKGVKGSGFVAKPWRGL